MLLALVRGLALVAAMGLTSSISICQPQSPVVSIPLVVTDGVATITLFFGIDPGASDSLDVKFGESELPPLPPSEIFDARFVGFDIGMPLGLGTLKDFRPGTAGMAGQRTHELMFQTATGRTVAVRWNLPAGTTAVLQDVYLGSIININMKDSGSYTVQNPSVFNRLKMTVQYASMSAVVSHTPSQIALYQNYPNPFNPSTTIIFELTVAKKARLSLWNMLGEEVRLLADGTFDSGRHQVPVNAANLPSGSYLYKLEAGSFVAVKRFVLLR